MTAPKLAVATKRGRYYRHPLHPDVQYLSVTNALSVINKPALVTWAARLVAEEAMDQLPALVRQARTDRAGAIAALKGQPYAKRDAAADLGSRIHAMAEAHTLDQPHPITNDLTPFLAQYLAFLGDFRPEFEASEITVAHNGHRYAGTLDAIATIGGARYIIDYKTSSTRPVGSAYPEYALQLAAYRHAEVVWLPDGTETPMPDVQAAAVLNLRPDGYALIPVRTDQDTFGAFLHALELGTFLNEQGDDVIGQPMTPPPVAVGA